MQFKKGLILSARMFVQPSSNGPQNLHAAGVNNLVTMGPVQELFSDGTGNGRSYWNKLRPSLETLLSRIGERKQDRVLVRNSPSV